MTIPGKGFWAAAAAAFAAGCATVKYSSPGALEGVAVKGIEGRPAPQHVVVNTSGYYLLWTLPLFSGDLRWNDAKKSINGGTSFFRDQVGVNELQSALKQIAEARDCDLADVHVVDSDTSYADATAFPLIDWLFGSSQMCMSALLVPRGPAE